MIVTVRSTRNPDITKQMSLQMAMRHPKRWKVLDQIDIVSVNYEPVTVPVPDGVKIVVAVIVYNRFKNIQEWVRCWQKSITDNAQLVVIHNYKTPQEKKSYGDFCRKNGIGYVPRENIGFDIGALQDVSKQRLKGFPEYDYLLWCTDDLWPQRKTFIQEYWAVYKEDVKATCYEISKEVNPHIRTTGFMMKKEDVQRIKFNVDPIITKSQCYDFEHRDKANSLIDQVKKFGAPVQICNIECSPMWDTGHNSFEAKMRRSRREKEHTENFK